MRPSQFLVDIQQITSKETERFEKMRSPEMQSSPAYLVSSSSGHKMGSLNNAITTDKFKEIIDNLFVPTASAFKKKAKEKEFRRPT